VPKQSMKQPEKMSKNAGRMIEVICRTCGKPFQHLNLKMPPPECWACAMKKVRAVGNS